MNKILIRALFFLCGLTLFTSCLKDDLNEGTNKKDTVYYGSQHIPNINEYMPQRLLKVLDSMHALNFGEEPPRLQGKYTTATPGKYEYGPAYFKADDLMLVKVKKTPNSHWMIIPTSLPSKQYLQFTDQHRGTARMSFWYEKGIPDYPPYFVETSSTDSTFYYVSHNLEHFTADSIAPFYFTNDQFTDEDFNSIYLIGKDDRFTIFYYEIRHIFTTNFQPMNAVIISGKVSGTETIVRTNDNGQNDTIWQPIIEDYVIGVETMKYYKENSSLSQILQAGGLATPGDLHIIKNNSVIRYGKLND